MSTISLPIERFFFGNEHWRSNRAVDEIAVYCDLLNHLQDRIDTLETRCRDEEVTLRNVQSVMSGYAIEIAMKSLWALDNTPQRVPHEHSLVVIFDGLKKETAESLKRLQLTRKDLEKWPKPFVSNRYSMEERDRDITVYQPQFLRSVIQLLQDKIEETRKTLTGTP